MNVTSFATGGVEVIRLAGRFDLLALPEFKAASRNALERPGVSEILVDLGAVEAIDCTALGSMLVLREDGKRSGKSIAIKNASGNVLNTLSHSGFQSFFAFK